MADVAIENRTEPVAKLLIAISRRFNDPDVLNLYQSRIKPVLSEFGRILICDYASDAADDVDYWMNRMNVMLDVADVHVFFDFDRSANTYYEWESSNTNCQYGPGVSLQWNFGVRPPVSERPLQIIIYAGAEPTAGIIFVNLAARLSQHVALRSDGEPGVLEQALTQVLRDWSYSLGESRSHPLKSADNAGDAAEELSASEYWEFKDYIATRLTNGESLSTITAAFVRAAMVPGDTNQPDETDPALQLLGRYKTYIVAYNRDLSRLYKLCAKVLIPEPSFSDVFAFAKQKFEMRMISAILRRIPDYAEAQKVHALVDSPVVRQMWNFVVLTKARRVQREMRSFGTRVVVSPVPANPFAKLVWGVRLLRTNVALQTLLRLSVPAGLLIIILLSALGRLSGGRLLVSIVALILFTALIKLSTAVGTSATLPPRGSTGRRYRWLLLENPKGAWIVLTIALVIYVPILLLLGYLFLSWLGNFVPGGQVTIRAIVGTLFVLLILRIIGRLANDFFERRSERRRGA